MWEVLQGNDELKKIICKEYNSKLSRGQKDEQSYNIENKTPFNFMTAQF
jgi:hypothetical protein